MVIGFWEDWEADFDGNRKSQAPSCLEDIRRAGSSAEKDIRRCKIDHMRGGSLWEGCCEHVCLVMTLELWTP